MVTPARRSTRKSAAPAPATPATAPVQHPETSSTNHNAKAFLRRGDPKLAKMFGFAKKLKVVDFDGPMRFKLEELRAGFDEAALKVIEIDSRETTNRRAKESQTQEYITTERAKAFLLNGSKMGKGIICEEWLEPIREQRDFDLNVFGMEEEEEAEEEEEEEELKLEKRQSPRKKREEKRNGSDLPSSSNSTPSTSATRHEGLKAFKIPRRS